MDLWTEKYRPASLDDYVWKNADQRAKIDGWVAQGALPHLLLSGVQGAGKTSLAELLFNVLNVPKGDIMKINASRERDPDMVANKILTFCTTMSLNGGMKYILLDEADSMTPLAQRILRGEMENYHRHVRFILTCNYKNKIIPAIHSRCQGFDFVAHDEDEFLSRMFTILTKEGIAMETEEDVLTLQSYIHATHPDMRKCINLLQQNSLDGKLLPLTEDVDVLNWMRDAINLFKEGRFTEGRVMITNNAQPDNYEDIYRFFYENLELWGNTQEQQMEALLSIRTGLVNHGLVADVEINLAATIVELANISKG